MTRAPPAAGAAGGGRSSVRPLAEEAASSQQPQAAGWQILPRVQVPRGERLGQKAGHPEGRAQEVLSQEAWHASEGTCTNKNEPEMSTLKRLTSPPRVEEDTLP